MNKVDLKKDVPIDHLIKKMFQKNKNVISFEMSGFTQDEKNLLELGEDIDPYVSMDEIYSNIGEANKLSLASSMMRNKCSKQIQSKEDGDVLFVKNEAAAEYNSTKFDKETDAEKIINMAAGVEDDAESFGIISKQYWSLIGEIFSKIKTSLMIFFKKIFSFIDQDFNDIRAWYLINGKDNKDTIINNVDKKFMLKLPQILTFKQFTDVIKEQMCNHFIITDSIIYFYGSVVKDDKIDEERMNDLFVKSGKLIEESETKTVEKMKKLLYNDGVESLKETTAKEFFEKFDYDLLGDASISNVLYDIRLHLSNITQISNIVSVLSNKMITNDDYRKVVEGTFDNLQSFYLKHISSYIWLTMLNVRNLKTAYNICRTVLQHS